MHLTAKELKDIYPFIQGSVTETGLWGVFYWNNAQQSHHFNEDSSLSIFDRLYKYNMVVRFNIDLMLN